MQIEARALASIQLIYITNWRWKLALGYWLLERHSESRWFYRYETKDTPLANCVHRRLEVKWCRAYLEYGRWPWFPFEDSRRSSEVYQRCELGKRAYYAQFSRSLSIVIAKCCNFRFPRWTRWCSKDKRQIDDKMAPLVAGICVQSVRGTGVNLFCVKQRWEFSASNRFRIYLLPGKISRKNDIIVRRAVGDEDQNFKGCLWWNGEILLRRFVNGGAGMRCVTLVESKQVNYLLFKSQYQ